MLDLLCVAIGLAAGVFGGLFGIGGGIVIVPALVLALGFTQHKAQGTSLVALLAPVGIFALIDYWKAGNADLRKGAWIAAGFLIGAIVGAKIALGLSDEAMRKTFGVFLVALGVYWVLRK